MAAVAAPLALPPCPGCRGGREVNGLPCRECSGSGRARGRVRYDWRFWRGKRAVAVAGAAAVAAGTVVGWSRTLPGIGGAAAVTFGLAGAVHAIWHWLPLLYPALVIGGVFALVLDRQIP